MEGRNGFRRPYTITARGAAKALRGRSLYLQLLTEAVADFVCSKLDLRAAHVLYVGGGRFCLWAPLSAQDKLLNLRRELAGILWEQHADDLYFAPAAAPLTSGDFGDRIQELWGEVNRRLGEAKRRRWAEPPAPELAAVFEPREHGGNRRRAMFCLRLRG